MTFENGHQPDEDPGLEADPAGPQADLLHRCRALDGLHTVEDRADRIMMDILETDGSWQVNGPGEGTPCAVLVEIQVYGVRAPGRDIGQAIANWTAAARRAVEGQGGDP